MSRRHHHHLQPYDFDRFTDHSRDRDRDRDRDQARGIEYQDDSLSSINSDEDSYLHHQHKDKKGNFYNPKLDPGLSGPKLSNVHANKPDKPSNIEPLSYHPKEMPKIQYTAPSSAPDPTSDRLSRLESMFEQLVKQNVQSAQQSQPIALDTRKNEKTPNEKRGQFSLEPRRYNFTTSMWINKIQDVSIRNNWDEKTTISYMGSQMSGIIRAWYNVLPSYEYTWPEWKILISKMFPDNTDFVTSLKRLVTRLKQAEETMNAYYFCKMYLIECCKITGEDAVSCLIDGLNNQSIQEQAKSQNFLTPETLYSQFLAVLPEYTVDYSPPTIVASNDPPISTWYYQEPEAIIEPPKVDMAMPPPLFDFNQQGEFSFHPPPNQFEEEQGMAQKRQGPVHARLDKRFIKPKFFKNNQNNKVPMAAKVCGICSMRGHLARSCRNKKMMKCCKLGDHASCFYKPCSINGHQMDCFVDTGCTTVTIKEEIAKALELVVTRTCAHIETYGGGSVSTLGETEVQIQLDSVGATVKGVIVPNHVQETAVVVGQEFLNQEHVCAVLHNETLNIFKASN